MLRQVLLSCLLILLLPVTGAVAQTGMIEGQVTDAQNGDPLPGVNVVIQESSLGAATNTEGEYAIEGVPEGEHTVEARFVGYRSNAQTVQVVADEVVTLNFELAQSALDLEEVVVTGTGGPVEKRKLGNTISTVNASDLVNAPVQNFSEMLQGREPGVSGLPSSGMTGEGAQIRIRGSASLSQSNEPVIYVDGIRINSGGGFGGLVSAGGGGTTSRLDDINPDAIERIEVLKGAAAATLYGTEASNGVIQIFTKRGAIGPPEFNFSLEQGLISMPGDKIKDQVGFARTQAQADTMSNYFGRDVQPWELVSQNALRDMFETGRLQTYTGSVSGGAEGINYFVSGRFSTEDGPLGAPEGIDPLAQDKVTRAQGTANLNILPTEELQIRVATSYNNTNFDTYENSNNIYAPIELAILTKPEHVGHNNRYGNTAFATVREALQQSVSQEVQRFTGSLGLNYRPLEVVNFDGTFGVDFTDSFNEEVRPYGWNVDNFTSDTPLGRRVVSAQRNLELSLDLKGNLSNDIGERFESVFVLGFQGFITRSNIESSEGVDFPGPGFNVVSAASNISVEELFTEVTQLGIFGQEQLGINDYIFATVGVRMDANSAFGSDFSAVVYPKASVSVIPSDAPFWTSSLGPISSLRVRAALGQSGLQPGAFDAFTTYSALSPPGGTGVVPDNLGNPDLKPEISTEWEVGTELGLLNESAALEVTYWNRTVDDVLVNRQFPVTGGFRASQLVNIGELKGQGVELGLNANVFQRDNISFDLFANASYLWEQITDMGGAPPIKAGGSYPRVRNYLTEGYAPGAHFGAKLMDVPSGVLPVDFNGDGEPDSEEQVLTYLSGLTPESADLPESAEVVLMAQEGGNPNLAAPLNHYLGKPTPDWQGAFGFDLGFLENFSLSTLFEYKFGDFYVNNMSGGFQQRSSSIGRNIMEAARVDRNFMTGGVDANGNPQNDPEVRLEALETWLNDLLALAPFSGLNNVESADFLRWRELSLTYNAPGSFAEDLGVQRLSFTISGRNLAVWTKYGGSDPEANEVSRGGAGDQIDQNFRSGIEAWNLPLPRRFTIKMRVGF